MRDPPDLSPVDVDALSVRLALMPELTLHMGSGKTGTSSIQAMLDQRRADLLSSGVLYPLTPGRTRHVRLGLSLRTDHQLAGQPSWPQQQYDDPAAFRAWFRDALLSEIAASGASRVLMSDEALYGSNQAMLDQLRLLIDAVTENQRHPLRLLVYLRRQDDHLVSRYQQVVKTGETRSLVQRTQETDFAGVYDYAGRLRLWRRRLSPTAILVRPFERAGFAGGSLLTDFVHAAGLDLPAQGDPVGERNASLDAEAVEFLRLVNMAKREGALPGWQVRDQRQLADHLAALSTGPTLTLPAQVLEQFMAPWIEGNRAVAREFLPEHAGDLFQAPRKSAGTTTEQRLDPQRAEELLSAVTLPERAHDTIRALAVREASG